MPKIAAFIIPNHRLKKEILHYKKKIKKMFGKQTYLNHLPHCSILTMNVTKKIFTDKKVKEPIIIKSKKNYYKVIKKSVFNSDPITNKRTIYFKVKKNFFLSNLQLNIINKIKRFKKKDKIPKFKFIWMKNNFRKYGYPFVNKFWKPHFTVASLEKNNYTDKFIINFIRNRTSILRKEKLKNIHFYQVNKNTHKFLFKVKLKI